MHTRLRKTYFIGIIAFLCITVFATACSPMPGIDELATPTSTPASTSNTDTAPVKTLLSDIVPARIGSSMAYDEKRAGIILFGGDGFNDTWSWNGQDWTQLYPASVPPARSQASMAYDEKRDQIILFGGVGITGTPMGDTWAWDGSNWLPLNPADSPPARAQANLVYDAALQRLVLFGGQVLGSNAAMAPVNDTWTWNGSNWTQQHPAISPSARSQASMAYDMARKQVLLFGGLAGNKSLNDTWTWDGKTWHQLHRSGVLPAQGGGGMIYDAATQHVVLLAGARDSTGNTSSTGSDLNDTWLWNGSSWTQQAAPKSLRGLDTISTYGTNQKMVVVVYVVHVHNNVVDDSQTWLWNGKTWSQHQ